jgi:tetratricopeptide (TPR) repeat protein
MNPQKNIVYNSTINAAGNVQIGDNITINNINYTIAEHFNHSILFLRIENTEGGSYAVQLTLKSRHADNVTLPLLREKIPINIDNQLFERVSAFQELRRTSPTTLRDAVDRRPDLSNGNETVLSKILFDTFFTGDILTVCRDFVALLEKRKIEELLVAISADDPRVLNLPFEMLLPHFFPIKLGEEKRSLAVARFGFVRTLEKDLTAFDMQGKPASGAPLKMLFVTALPENLDERAKMLEIEEEQKRLIEAIGSFEATGGAPKIVIEFLDTASLSDIKKAIAEHKHDILHISGHGEYKKDVKQGVLHLEDDDGNHRAVLGKELGEILRGSQSIKLLILSACETAVSGNGVVEDLAAYGIPSLIAMRFSVTDTGAKLFTTALYAALAKGETLTQAVAAARDTLWQDHQTQVQNNPQHLSEWFTPVVYLNQYTEGLVDLAKTYVLPEAFFPHSDFFKTKNTRLIGAGFIGRKRYLNQLRRHFAHRKHVVLHGLGGMGKTTLAEAFAHNYDNHSHETLIFRNGNQIAEKHILDELFARLAGDKNANPNTVRQLKQYLESDADPIEKLDTLIANYLQNRKTILIFDNFEDVQKSEGGEQERPIGSAALSAFMQHLCANTPQNCHLLFTTRYSIPDLAETVVHLGLDKMSYAESYRLSNFSAILRGIPLTERQQIFTRLDGHPRAYEFLEALLKNDKTSNWASLSAQMGIVEAKVWENLLLEKIYQRLDADLQGVLQMAAVCITRTPVAALAAISGQTENDLQTQLQRLHEWSLCFFNTENQTFEVHRLTREWMGKNVTPSVKVKEWAFKVGEYFKAQPTLDNDILAKDYFEIAEAWQNFAATSFKLQNYYQLIGLNQKAFELNQAVLEKKAEGKSIALALFNKGAILNLFGQNDQALELYEQSLAINKKISNRQGEGATLNNLATTAYAKSDYDTALRYLEQSLAIDHELGNRKGEGTTLNNVSQIYKVRGDYDTALRYLEQALEIDHELGDLQGGGTTLNNISQIHKVRGNYDTALRYLEQSLAISQQIGDRDGEGATLNNISQIHKVRGNYDTALRYLEQSLDIRQQIGNRKGEGATLNNISQIYHAKGDYDTALRYLEQSLAIKQQIGDRQGEGTTLNNISQIYHEKGSYDTALRYLEKALDIREQIGDREGEGATLNNISQIYSAKGDYDTALRYLEQSLAIQQQIGDINGMATTLHNMGSISFGISDFERATPYFIEAYRILKKIGSPNVKVTERYLNAIIERIGEAKFQEILSKMG